MSDSEVKKDATVTASTATSPDSSATVAASNANTGRGTYLVSIIVLMVIIAIIIFAAWYLVQRNKTNTPSAIITNFGTTFISTKNGKILSFNSILNSDLSASLLQIMNARGFKDPLTSAIDVTCGWTLIPAAGSETQTGIINSGYVTIQNNFTQEYCAYRPFPLVNRPDADIQFIGDVPPTVNFPPPDPFPNPPPDAYRGWFKVIVSTIPGKVKASTNITTGKTNPTPDTTITVITLESVYKLGSFIIANTDGTITVGATTPNTDHIFQVVN